MLTLYFLQSSRAFRTAWLLEELNVDYELKFADRRPDGSVPPELGIPTSKGKAPAIRDGNLVLGESGAIAEYLIEKYDTTHRLLPTQPEKRAKIRELMWAAEGALMLHAEAVFSARLAAPAEVAPEIEAKLAKSVQHDLDWLEGHLKETSTKFLAGDHVTVADTMMAFSIQDIFANKLAPAGKSWPRINEWLKTVESGDVYQRAVKRTGHHF
ncbi:hypothetical protein Asppvi_008352 [Aspergillus pseudoviridinutans]|uniref:Glutathione S-transferase n=1 Tax=Aspergillus pseudoviridinutans TaxID=1517512 RepID=A0A9P3BDV3_9EURO|nr:uncharacterized protein Asppvi_008352 [Aspergillus pseudoviridinutans]GIJ89412.1 hypothetical protein Asppvi_008352 [Aspergillus pseudoviridinutans]